MREHYLPVFHPRLVRARIATLDRAIFAKHRLSVGVDEAKEVVLHGDFLGVFGDISATRAKASGNDPTKFSGPRRGP